MARNSEFPENGRGPEFAGGGTSDDTQCSPLPKACQIKRPRESDGDTVMVDAVEPIRKMCDSESDWSWPWASCSCSSSAA